MPAAENFDVVIVGAGGAGLFCAGVAGARGRSVLVIDHASVPGEKIRISGGGRCNFTNRHTTQKNFLSENPAFCISALKSYTQADFIALVERHNIAWHEKTLGQLFCDGSSQQIIDMLLAECAAGGAQIRLQTEITAVEKSATGFRVTTGNGADKRAVDCASLVVASGGLSIPKIGATGFGYDLARQFGLRVVEPRPALVPFIFDNAQKAALDGLAGVAVDAVAACGKTRFAEALLFTHKGLSGPAILQISSYWRPGLDIVIDLVPGTDVFTALKDARVAHPKQEVETQLARLLPKRLADRWCALAGVTGRLADLSDARLRVLADSVNRWRFAPIGTEGYRTAEVTAGGVDTHGLSSKTMEARAVPGLYFIGEVVDVTGHLGGFNFQWAWSSAYAAAQNA